VIMGRTLEHQMLDRLVGAVAVRADGRVPALDTVKVSRHQWGVTSAYLCHRHALVPGPIPLPTLVTVFAVCENSMDPGMWIACCACMCSRVDGRHVGPVWQLEWVTVQGGGSEQDSMPVDEETLVSVSDDGRVVQWTIRKEFKGNSESVQSLRVHRSFADSLQKNQSINPGFLKWPNNTNYC